MVVGSNLGEPKLNLSFAIFGFGLNIKGWRKTLVAKEGWKTMIRQIIK